MTRATKDLIDDSARLIDQVRESSPLIQCLTNAVVTNFTANVLLAVGATPAMVDIPEEAPLFAPVASGMLINLGTPTAEQRTAMALAAAAASQAGTPWVLDPVAVGALPARTELAARLVKARPTVIRGNASEIMATSGSGAGGRGVDAADDVDSALDSARKLARRSGSVVALSGPIDAITDGTTVVRIANGDVLLTRVTGGGCALGAVIAAFLAQETDPLTATVAACTTYAVAAELAVKTATGPGSFAPAFLDALAIVDGSDLRARAQLQ